MTTALVVITIIVGMALAAMAFTIWTLTRQLQRVTLLVASRNPIEAARAERMASSTSRPPIPEPGINPAELP